MDEKHSQELIFKGEFKNELPYKGVWVDKNTGKPLIPEAKYEYTKYPYAKVIVYDFVLFEGNIINGKLKGECIEYYKRSKKVLFRGRYKNNKRHGPGTLYHQSGAINVQSNWQNGTLNGKNIKIYDKEENLEYVGDFIHDKMCGFGTAFKNNHKYYEGEWKNNLINGEGTLFYKSGQPKFKGTFKQQEPQMSFPKITFYVIFGNCIMSNQSKFTTFYDESKQKMVEFTKNGGKYKGHIYDKTGEKTVSGTLEIPSFESFIDEMNDNNYDQIDGEGKLYLTNKLYEGQFRSKKPYGHGTLYDRYGAIIEKGLFQNGYLLKGIVVINEKVCPYDAYIDINLIL